MTVEFTSLKWLLYQMSGNYLLHNFLYWMVPLDIHSMITFCVYIVCLHPDHHYRCMFLKVSWHSSHFLNLKTVTWGQLVWLCEMRSVDKEYHSSLGGLAIMLPFYLFFIFIFFIYFFTLLWFVFWDRKREGQRQTDGQTNTGPSIGFWNLNTHT